MKNLITILALSALVIGCGGNSKAGEGPSAPASVATSTKAAPAPDTPGSTLSGAVLETMDSGGYTYMKLKTASGEEWVATPQTPVTKGQKVFVIAQMTTEKFQSSTLNRTFDRIVFGTIAADGGSQAGASTAAASASPVEHMKPKADIDVKVPKAEGANAKTVAELWEDRAALAGKEVVVRGKVVKSLTGIMGTNWMHIQDGTGSRASGDNDLTITTDTPAGVGDVVTVSGVLTVDKDFGAGYSYAVIIEKARVVK